MKKNKPLRVLQIIGIVCGGGVEAVIMNYYRNINRENVQFDFIVDGKEKSLLDDEIESLGGKVYHVTAYKDNIFRYMYDVYKVMKNNQYSIIHDNMNTMSFFSLLPAWIAGKPIRIIHNHTTNAKEDGCKYYMKKVLRHFAPLFANHYLACSVFAGEWMYGKKAMMSDDIKVINNAIDLKKFAYSRDLRKKLRSQYDIADNEIIVGHVGRIAPQKNHMFLLDIFADFYKAHHNSRLMLIGDGPLREEVICRAKELGISRQVMLLGLRKNVYELYNVMDIFLLPSLYEGLPVVTVEAQANGVPACVSTAIPKEAVVLDNVKRLPLSAGAPVWRENMEDLLEKRNLSSADDMTSAGFSIKKEAVNLEGYYQELLTRSK